MSQPTATEQLAAHPGQVLIGTWQPAPPLAARPKRIYEVTALDAIFSLVTLVIGYLWWDWVWPHLTPNKLLLPGVGVTAFFVLALIVSVLYYRLKGVHLSARALVGVAVILAAALPFALFATTPLHFLLGLVLLVLFVIWHAYVSGTAAGTWPSGAWLIDFLNQAFVAPVRNAGAWWAGLTSALRGRRRLRQVVIAVVGLIVGLPVILLVTALLMSADAGFRQVIDTALQSLRHINAWSIIWRLILGLPVAIFGLNLLYANAHRSGTGAITPESAARANQAVHKIPVVGLATPMVLLAVIYVVFFAAMGSYLFGGFAGQLPAGLTYADYARSGFFQLAVVTAINLAVVGFGYLFGVRRGGAYFSRRSSTPSLASGVGASSHPAQPALAYPPSLRWLSLALSVLTLLLIATAVSKMALYIGAFGLTRLRLYTLVFMIALAVVFLTIGARHLVRFRVGPPLVSFLLVGFLALTWANTDRIIAEYNVSQYQSGRLASLDVDYLANSLSSATIPTLVELSQGTDPVLAAQAQAALDGFDWTDFPSGRTWPAWNAQDQRAFDLTHS